MAKTISTHNGSAANREHNVRNPRATDKQQHIDKSLKGQNEILHDEKPREAYRRIFGAALEAYNAKQDRPERQIRDYFSHVEKDSKKHPVYEMIVQIGDRNDTGIDAPVERECLKEFYAGWKERNPNLECIGAYIHADETDGTVHMHVDYVPVATGYKRGMETQNGLVKALEQQGFKKDGARTAQIQWEARENAALETICERHGIEIYHPMSEGRKHLDTEAYKAQQQAEFAYETYANLMESIDEVQADLEASREEAALERSRAETTRQKLAEAAEVAQRLQKATNALENKKTVLEGKIEGLEGEIEVLEGHKERMGGEVVELADRIQDSLDELEVLDRAIKEKNKEGAKQLGMDAWIRKVNDTRDQDQAAKRDGLLARFAEYCIQHVPGIRELWQKYQEAVRPRQKQKSKDEPTK